MTEIPSQALATYAHRVTELAASPSSTEISDYPAIESLLDALLRNRHLPFDARVSTSQRRSAQEPSQGCHPRSMRASRAPAACYCDRTMKDDLLERAARRLAEDPRVVAAWGFGSRARREAGPGSDVDVAVLLDEDPELVEELRLRSDVVEALGRDDVDLVVLNGAPPLVRHEVVAAGRRLVARDEEAADRFEEQATREAFDTAYLRRVQQQLAREARR